ncbi:hypothetical protein [Azospirillum sp.]|uniref:hypothetical protein n=1 Tax=Azospirillum sp. TaxID=34012 RepID=UPI003D72CC8B
MRRVTAEQAAGEFAGSMIWLLFVLTLTVTLIGTVWDARYMILSTPVVTATLSLVALRFISHWKWPFYPLLTITMYSVYIWAVIWYDMFIIGNDASRRTLTKYLPFDPVRVDLLEHDKNAMAIFSLISELTVRFIIFVGAWSAPTVLVLIAIMLMRRRAARRKVDI